MRFLEIIGKVIYAVGVLVIGALLLGVCLFLVGFAGAFGFVVGKEMTGEVAIGVVGAIVGVVVTVSWLADAMVRPPGRINAPGVRRAIPLNVRAAVIARDAFTCRHCGCTDAHDFEIDHVIPIARGGTDDITNLQTLCRRCNRSKGARYIG